VVYVEECQHSKCEALSSNPSATKKTKNSKTCLSWVPVAHACNPSFSGGRDQEDRGSKPAPGIVLKDLSRYFSKDIQVDNRYMKKRSTSLFTREMKIKATMKYYFKPAKLPFIKKT
jgi:hypothetical protein